MPQEVAGGHLSHSCKLVVGGHQNKADVIFTYKAMINVFGCDSSQGRLRETQASVGLEKQTAERLLIRP